MAENRNNSALKKFRSAHLYLGESTVLSFKKYYEAFKKGYATPEGYQVWRIEYLVRREKGCSH